MSVTLTFLGSGDAFGTDGRLQTRLALRGGAATIPRRLRHFRAHRHEARGRRPERGRRRRADPSARRPLRRRGTKNLLEAARDTDCFVCEAYTFDRKVRFHLDYATVRAAVPRFGARRIALTHMGPSMIERRDEAAIECASDGLTRTLD